MTEGNFINPPGIIERKGIVRMAVSFFVQRNEESAWDET